MAIQTQNPANGKIVKKFKASTAAEIERAVKNAHAQFLKWREVPMAKRAELMRAAARVLRENRQKYAEIITEEMGKPLAQSLSEVDKCATNCEYFADNAEKFLQPQQIQSEFARSYVRFDPLGIVLAIMPWNFPFWQVFRFAAPALMAGNGAILKHASNVPKSTLAIEEVFVKAGFPKGLFKSLLIDSKAVAKLIADDHIAAVTITGSEAAGSSVAEVSGRNLKKIVLELGGSDPFIVLQDANLDAAATAAVQSRTINSGQSCIAAKRFIVEKPAAKEFTRLVVEKMSKLRTGDPTASENAVGPLARGDLREGLDKQVQGSVRKGAKVLLGGHKVSGAGFYYEPTVLVNLKPGMPAYDQELFGPVAGIIEAKDANDAIRIANSHRYGLGANLWTSDLVKAEALAAGIESGTVAINDFVKSDPRFPFGGVKKSGYGRELSDYGIKEFVNIKMVVAKDSPSGKAMAHDNAAIE